MKKININLVVTKINGTEDEQNTYVPMDVDHKAGWGLPMHANNVIVSAEVVSVDLLELGDEVMIEVKRGSIEDEDGLVDGGKWVKKSGVIDHVYADGLQGFVKFYDGDSQAVSMIRDDDGYPGKNIQPIAK